VNETSLEGLRVLIIEDEAMIAMAIEDTLAAFGCTVAGVASRLEDALSTISSLLFDIAILDVNLNGRHTYPVAETLARNGVPFVLATGYGAAAIPEAFRSFPILAKPFRRADLKRSLAAALAGAQDGAA
jgi:CheY-like chemotaxis protein